MLCLTMSTFSAPSNWINKPRTLARALSIFSFGTPASLARRIAIASKEFSSGFEEFPTRCTARSTPTARRGIWFLKPHTLCSGYNFLSVATLLSNAIFRRMHGDGHKTYTTSLSIYLGLLRIFDPFALLDLGPLTAIVESSKLWEEKLIPYYDQHSMVVPMSVFAWSVEHVVFLV
ncbi:hypothetical protein SCLCIDRAFT_936900 [Scleroderma citrinum Foug A]|uniref:Uncharacterized protein n=1 Tax=Scleroderma citrinum Foug A TaxID=1036808 RepID=A0A0C3DXL9_9AGAM|nr:hypothetical protein SCLCIDRAFT_936900 [Scleroderma citrinum Foug A]